MSDSAHPPADLAHDPLQAARSAGPLPARPAEPPRPAPLRGIDSLGFVMDVPVAVTVELGRRQVRIAEVLRLGPGSVLELDKASGEPLDLYVNNRLIARGEAVVIGERYGIRLTEVVMNDEARKGEGG
jgi:flagellar motor switch protein FliN